MSNPHSILSFVFPERGNSTLSSAFLVSSKEYSATELSKFVNDIGEVVSSFRHENHQFLLEKRNRENFYKLLKMYDGKHDYPQIADTFLVETSNVEEISVEYSQSEKDTYFINGSPIQHDAFCEAASGILNNPENSYAIIAGLDIVDGLLDVRIVKDGCENEVSLEIISPDIYSVYEWISTHRRPVRVYMPNPEKHGTDGKGAQKSNKGDSVGILLCSNEEAEILMHHALGIKNGAKKLFIYDFDRMKYMQFNKGGGNVDNNYHGWHVNSEHDIIKHPKDLKILKLADKFKKVVGEYKKSVVKKTK